MMTAATHPYPPVDSPTLAAALALHEEGFWPVAIYPPDAKVDSPGKRPIGFAWGATPPTADTLRATWGRYPRASVGLRLGKVPGICDLEVDDPATGYDTLEEILQAEQWETRGWSSARGSHSLVLWDERFAGFGAVLENDPRFPGLSLRFGGPADEQVQSVCPPSPTTRIREDGTIEVGEPREWNGVAEIARLPDIAIEEIARRLAKKKRIEPPPSSVKFRPRLDSSLQAYVEKAVNDELELIRSTAEGNRNVQLNTSCFNLGTLIGAGVLNRQDIEAAIWTVARHAGGQGRTRHTDSQIAKTMKSGLDAGIADPRDLSGKGQILTPKLSSKYGSVSNVSNVSKNPEEKPADADQKKDSADSADAADAADGSVFEDTEWLAPRLSEEEPAEPFPLEVFPDRLKTFALEVAKAIQCPVDYVAAPMLAVAGGVVGLSVNLVVKRQYEEAPNLYLAVVGPPGTKKSPALKTVCRPIFLIDRENRERYDGEKLEYEMRLQEWEAKKRDPLRGLPPTAPNLGELTLDDVTREAVADVHSRNPRGCIVVKDELVSWVLSLNAYKASGKGDDKQFWLKVNSGAMVKVNRVGRKQDPIIISRPCVSIVGCLTPSMLPSIRDDKRDDGWLDRILFAYPDPIYSPEWEEDEVSEEAADDWEAIVRRLWKKSMYVDVQTGRLRPFFVHMTDDAKERWRVFIREHRAEQRRADFPEALKGPWSKLEGFCARLALILVRLERACDADPEQDDVGRLGNVNGMHLEHAIRLTNYFKSHFRRARVVIVRRDLDGSHEGQLILRWLERSVQYALDDPDRTQFSRDLEGRGFAWFSERDVSRQFTRWDDHQQSLALRWLASRRCIRSRPAPARVPGRPGANRTPEYDINPHLLSSWRNTEASATSATSAEFSAAVAWLRSNLSSVPRSARDVLDDAERAGFSSPFMHRVATHLKVREADISGELAWYFPSEDSTDG